MIGQTVGNYELHLQLGNIAEAVDAYEIFVDIWKDADAVLEPQVEYARDRINEFVAQTAREPQ